MRLGAVDYVTKPLELDLTLGSSSIGSAHLYPIAKDEIELVVRPGIDSFEVAPHAFERPGAERLDDQLPA